MVNWALFVSLLVVHTVASPLRRSNGYEFDVKHPGGRSRVHVRSGSEKNIDPNNEYIADATYVNPHYAGPPYQSDSYGLYQGNYNIPKPLHYHGQDSKVPVYVERSRYPKSARFQYASPHDRYEDYGQSPYYPKQHRISQSAVESGPFYEKPVDRIPVNPTYSNPQFVQQVDDDTSPIYLPNKLQQVSLDPEPAYAPVQEKYPDENVGLVPVKPVVVQQIASDDFPEISAYPKSPISQLPLINYPADHVQSPIDQQVLVDEQEEIPAVIYQKPLVEKPISQVLVDVPSTKSVPVLEQSPIVQQASLDDIPVPSTKNVPVLEQSPIVQQSSLDDIPPSSIVHYDDVSQKAIYPEPAFGHTKKFPVLQQQLSIDDALSEKPGFYPDVEKSGLIQESINPVDVDDVTDQGYGSPVIQTPLEEHPSQAVYDSSFEPSFSDTDHRIPSYSPGKHPRYHFVPTGPPYERISHSTEVIHGPPRPHFSYAEPPQKYIKTNIPVVQEYPNHHSVKYQPPPITKTFIPHAQEHVDSDVLSNPPIPHSVKQPLPPPPPITKTVFPSELSQVQEHVDSDILLAENPPVAHSVKIPPPPITKTVIPVELPHAQEHVDADILLAKNPPVSQSVKLPAPPPVSQSIKLPPPPPVSQSIKLPPPPPASQSVKLPPPIVKSHSLKLPPPFVPVYKPATFQKPVPSIKRPFYGYKPRPSYVKLPAAGPQWNKPYQSHFTKSAPPSYSVKRPYPAAPVLSNPHLKSPSHIKVPVTKTAPVSYPVVSNAHSVKHPKATLSADGPPHIKTTPLAPNLSAPSSIKGYPSVKGNPSHPHSIKQPYPAIVSPHSDPVVENTHLKQPPYDVPPKKYLPITHGAEHSYPPPNEEFRSHASPEEPEEKSPFDKYPPVSHAIRLPSVNSPPKSNPDLLAEGLGDKSSGADFLESSKLDSYPRVSHAVRLPSGIPTTTLVPNLFAAVPQSDSHGDVTGEELLDPHTPVSEPLGSVPRSEALSSPPISHSVRLAIPRRGSSRGSRRVEGSFDEPRQNFPAFPVESAFNQRDPVSDKVADLTNSFTRGSGYVDSNPEPEEDESPKAQSVDEAKIEIDRINRQIGSPFGERIHRRSRFT